MSLAQLVYSSDLNLNEMVKDRPLGETLRTLVERARVKNSQIHVTGILLYNAVHFLQVLEGHPMVLNRLFARIAADPRHNKVQRLATLSIEDRLFNEWHMGLLNVDESAYIDAGMFERFRREMQYVHSDSAAQASVINLLREFKSALECDSLIA